ncbi:serine/threonine protein kinase [Streptomyces sp. WAC 01529]|uniref:serine/threonine-protein kinase n=1 Tax=Streptomyces sp. WAC 01529 TaxID=2203205 RepID=UPI000F6B9BAA|nr:serine/threonine-protein kinase [Streptomyces sp. WAC 01529]AZM52686.1 serine/threonine protein kinase [Streptomyces sp. WAC 01529]
MDPLITEDPSHIGPYRLIARLGAGGMGLVYLGRSDVGRTVAVKVVQTAYAKDPEFRRRFAHEVAAARRVGGAWTAAVLDADTEAQVPWVATQYVAGPSLQAVVAEDFGPLPEASVRALASGLARALVDIHTAGLIHRDLKPGNVLVTVDGPRVIDFGIARALETLAEGAMTRTGAVIGSPGFMSPEQVRGQRLTPASDIFCLGSVLAYAATGRSPFGTTDSGLHALMFRVAKEEPGLNGIPEPLLGLVRECLRKDPGARPAAQDVMARTATDPDEPWLPERVLSQLGRHSAQLLDFAPLQTPEPTAISGPAAPVPPAAPAGAPAATPTHPSPRPAWEARTQTATHTPPPPAAPALHNAPTSAASAPSAPTRPRRRRLVVAAASATALAVLVGGLFVIRPWDGDSPQSGGGGGEKNKTSTLPAKFAGTWQGAFAGGPSTPDHLVRLKVTKGGRGDKVVEYSQRFGGHVCVYSSRLTSVSGSTVVKVGKGTLERAEPKAASGECAEERPAMTLKSPRDDTFELVTGEASSMILTKDRLSDPGTKVLEPFRGSWSGDLGMHFEEGFDYEMELDLTVSGLGEQGVVFRSKEEGKICHYVTEPFALTDDDGVHTLHTTPATLSDDAKSEKGCPDAGPLLDLQLNNVGVSIDSIYVDMLRPLYGDSGHTGSLFKPTD